MSFEYSLRQATQDTLSTTQMKFVTKSDSENIPDFKGELGEVCVRYSDIFTTIYVGTDNKDDLVSEDYYNELGKATIIGVKKALALEIDVLTVHPISEYNDVIVEACGRATYKFDKYKSKEDDAYTKIDINFFWETSDVDVKAIISDASSVANAVAYARDLQNENAGIVTPEYLVQESLKLIDMDDNLTVEILREDMLKQKGLNLLLAVGQGSPTQPRLIIIKYIGNPHDDDVTAIVGKGVTFDSGGLSLKPSSSMVDMRMDMSGASAVLGTVKYLKETNARVNVIAVIPTAHNAIGSDVYYLGDTIKSYNGKTVEIHNTDAEGRLILADALAYVVKNYEPTQIIDLATLTGAIVVALGDTIAGIFSNHDELATDIFDAGEICGERVWRLPIRKEHRDAMKGAVGDLRNISNIGRNCGSITASAFLENFVDELPWCHIDIAGTAHLDKIGGTGWGVRLLIEYLLNK